MWRMKFVWDPAKNRTNQREHGVSSEEAIRVFDAADEALELVDELHTDIEARFITIGPVRGGLVLVVCTERVDDTIRVISARWDTRRERDLYHRRMEHRR